MLIRFFVVRYPRALLLAAWMSPFAPRSISFPLPLSSWPELTRSKDAPNNAAREQVATPGRLQPPASLLRSR